MILRVRIPLFRIRRWKASRQNAPLLSRSQQHCSRRIRWAAGYAKSTGSGRPAAAPQRRLRNLTWWLQWGRLHNRRLVRRRQGLEKKVDLLFAKFQKPGSPGCAIAVIKGNRVVHQQGYGLANLESGASITPTSVFQVASVSKQFTAFAILLLEAEDKLSLDDDIQKHLPEMAHLGQPVTIRHLLHHTSGLRGEWGLLELAG